MKTKVVEEKTVMTAEGEKRSGGSEVPEVNN